MAVGELELTLNLRRKGLNVFICWWSWTLLGQKSPQMPSVWADRTEQQRDRAAVLPASL